MRPRALDDEKGLLKWNDEHLIIDVSFSAGFGQIEWSNSTNARFFMPPEIFLFSNKGCSENLGRRSRVQIDFLYEL